MNAMHKQFQFEVQHADEICAVHNELKVLMFGRTTCPSCAKELLEKSQIEHEKAVNQMVREKHFAGSMIPERHAQSGFNNYDVIHQEQQIAKAECAQFTRDQNAGKTRNLIMTGRTGTGKTHLACAVARNVLNAGKYVRYITSADMANLIANAWSKADDSEAAAIYRFTEYDLLILDEYGLHDQHEKKLELVHKVLYARYDAKKSTMLISNWTIEQLKENLGDRLWSRFQHDDLAIINSNWKDGRVKGGAA